MDVLDWLRMLGLGQYQAAFRENDVSADLVPSLTAQDLKELGVNSVGHRRLLLEAIARLRADHVLAASPIQQQSSPAIVPDSPYLAPEPAAERRQLSVMFCDLIGSTALSSRIDPEDLGEVLRSYQLRVTTAIGRFGGFIASYVGDGVLVYFGWPEAREADAERAVRAGLASAAAVSETPVHGEWLEARIGIATGIAVVGEEIGSGDSRQRMAVGETLNRAARLQQLAGANGVVIDAATRRLVGGLFDCDELGAVALKGLPETVPAWKVLGECSVDGRFAAFHPDSLTPLIGREEELGLLLRRWRQVQTGEGQVVLIAGEPGIGKSRLIAELEDRLRGEPHASLGYFCSPHHQESALYPVITRWEHEAGFARGDLPADKLSKLEAVLLPSGVSAGDIALFADLLEVPLGDRYAPLTFSPQQKKQKTLIALTRRLISRAREQPILMLFEDAHWADPSSLELLDTVIGLLPDA
jgi:class 3 adenylate cyclase